MTRLRRLAQGLPWLTGLFLALAYARMAGVESASVTTADAEQWLFSPEDTSPGLVVAIAAWLLHRRRDALARLPDAPGRLAAATLCGVALAVFVWAQWNAAYDLLALSLVASIGAVASALKGGPGLRVVSLPCVALLLSIPIPSPLYNEVVWQLQLTSASGARAALELFGFDFTLAGVVLGDGEQLFLVIEECSGLRSIRTLVLVAIVIRELLHLPLRGLAILVATALPLALLLNIARVAIVAGSHDPAALGGPGSHVGQGLAILAAGTVVLFLLAHFLSVEPPPDREVSPPLLLPWGALCAGQALFAVLALVITPWSVSDTATPDLGEIPREQGPWRGTDRRPDRLFTGQLPLGQIEQRSYDLDTQEGAVPAAVSLFVGVDAGLLPRLRPYASKLGLPGRDWQVESVATERLWSLSQDVEVVHARRGEERALVYVYAQADEGLLRESLRSLLALERGPFARDARRVVVRMSTRLGDDDLAEHRARRILDRFVGDFRGVLASL